MKHVDDFETTPLPEDLGREFTANAPCVAVFVEASSDADAGDSADTSADRGATPSGTSRRASVTVYRVGDGYVVECEGAGGDTETVGMGPGQLDAYVDRVRQDDEWTVLSIAVEGTRARRERLEGESSIRR